MKTEIAHDGTEPVIYTEKNGKIEKIATGIKVPKEDFDNWIRGEQSVSGPILDEMKANPEQIFEESGDGS